MLSNEFGRLAKGNKYGIQSTDTIEFILESHVPAGKKVTYATFVCDHCPLKSEPWRVRSVVGGDKLPYAGDTSSPAASILDKKLMVNSVISNASNGARFLSGDLGNFFLGSKMKTPEYMKIPYAIFLQEIIEKYNLEALFSEDGFMFNKIKKGMYG